MLLTVGMAHYEDFHRCRSTVLDVLKSNYWTKDMLEIIVVDNSPENSKHSKELHDFITGMKRSGLFSIRYVRDDGPPSSYRPRGRVFEEAKGDFVLVTDCHIETAPGAFNRFYKWAQSNPECDHLLCGPYVHDAGAPMMIWTEMAKGYFSTSYGDGLRNEMWGKWKSDDRGANIESPPFEISGMGLGLFACRREAWLGFNPHFRGFGGGEKYLHEKYRKAGRATFCLPFMRWMHGTQSIGPRPYPLSRYARIRNMVIGDQELGNDIAYIHAHWVDRGESLTDDELRVHLVEEHKRELTGLDRMSRLELDRLHANFKLLVEDWDYLMQDPIGHTSQLSKRVFASGKPLPMPTAAMTTSDYFKWTKQRGDPRYRKAMDDLAVLSSCVDMVTEFTSRRESTVAFLSVPTVHLVSHTSDPDMLIQMVDKTLPSDRKRTLRLGISSMDVESIPPTDMLFLDSVPHYPGRCERELRLFSTSVRRFIVIKGTREYGQFAEGHRGDENKPGLWKAIRNWMADNPEWFVVSNDFEADLSVLGRLEEDRPEVEKYIWPPGHGPGTNFKRLAEMLELPIRTTCGACAQLQADMDTVGWEGCEKKFDAIVDEIRNRAATMGIKSAIDIFKAAEGPGQLTLSEKRRLAIKTIKSGLAFKINPLDPWPGLVRLAINDAKAESMKGHHVTA